MGYKYFYILCSCELACAHASSPDLLLTNLLRVPAKPYLQPTLLPGEMNSSMHCPNSHPPGGMSQSPSLQSFTHVWLKVRGAGGWELAVLGRLWLAAARTSRSASRSAVMCESKALGTALTRGASKWMLSISPFLLSKSQRNPSCGQHWLVKRIFGGNTVQFS